MATKLQNEKTEIECNPKRIAARLELAKSERRHSEPLLDECTRLYLPGRKRFYNDTSGLDNAADIYDETGANALHEYASRLHAGMTPNFTKFALFQGGPDVDEQDRSAVDKDLEEITDYCFEEIWASNFSSEAHEAYLDMGISVGNLLVERGQGRSLLHHNALPMTELYLEAGPRDEIGGMFREREICNSFIKVLYPKAEMTRATETYLEKEPDNKSKIVDAIWTDHSSNGDAAYHAVMLNAGSTPEIIYKRRMTGEGSNPFIGFRVGKAAGEVWGRGPALNTLPATRTMNLTLEMLLQNAAMQLIGMYHVDDDSIVNADTITLEPGAILPRMAGTRGLERIDTQGGEFRLMQIVLQDQSLKIRKGLYNDMLSDPNRTPASALEVSERMADLANRMSASFGRLHHEFIRPYMMRVLYLAVEAGKVELPTLRGERLSVAATSPLAAAQGQRDIQNLVQYHQISTALFGPKVSSAQYAEGELMPYLRKKLDVSEKLFLEGPEMAQKVAALMGAELAGMQAGGAPAGPVQPM